MVNTLVLNFLTFPPALGFLWIFVVVVTSGLYCFSVQVIFDIFGLVLLQIHEPKAS